MCICVYIYIYTHRSRGSARADSYLQSFSTRDISEFGDAVFEDVVFDNNNNNSRFYLILYLDFT